MKTDEVHVPIINYENKYEITPTGKVWSTRRNLYLKPHMCGSYLRVYLQNTGVKYRPSIHRLVAQYFVEGYDEKLFVNHIDGDKLNNNASNLEWVTPLQNVRHAWDSGLVNTKGEGNGRSRLKSRHVEAIRRIGTALPQKEIAYLFGVGETAIHDILNNKTWVKDPVIVKQ